MTHNIAALQESIRSVAPGQSVKAATVDQSLVLTGSVATAEQAANIVQVANQFVDDPTRVVNQLSVAAPTQVNLQVRIAEVSRNIDRQLGIQWNDLSVGINGGRVGFSAARRSQGDYSARYGAIRGSFSIDVVLQALQEEGLVTIMAEPNLTARSGESADFLAGGEYPYSTVSDNGTNVAVQELRHRAELHPDGDGRQPHQPEGGDRGQRPRLHQQRQRAGAQHPPRRDDGRPCERPELRDRRADVEQLEPGQLAGAGARHGAGDRRAVPLSASSAGRPSSW